MAEIPAGAVGLFLTYTNPDGSVSQRIWMVSARVADALERQLGTPHGELELPPGAAQAAGDASLKAGTTAVLNPSRAPRGKRRR